MDFDSNELERLLAERATEEAARVERERAIDRLQVPVMEEIVHILDTKPVAEARELIMALVPHLIDYRKGTVMNTLSSLDSLRQGFASEILRINSSPNHAVLAGV